MKKIIFPFTAAHNFKLSHLIAQIISILGDFLIRNETIESKFSLYNWPRVHRLEFKIENHDDLLSFVQIDIIDTDVSIHLVFFCGVEKCMSFFRGIRKG